MYRVENVIGSGAFSTVRTVVDRFSGARYAAKCIAGCSATTSKAVASEVHCLVLSQHPSVLGFRDYLEESGCKYLITELVPGSNLGEALAERGSYPEDDCRVVISQILSALVHMHAVGVAHRDIKPENIVLGQGDDPASLRLVDFGLAGRLTNQAPCFTKPCGTPSYAAPEVLHRTPEYGTACDIWCCGVLLFNLLSGAPPFTPGRGLDALVKDIRNGAYSMKDPVWELISGGAVNFVQHLLSVDPAKRPTAATALKHPWLSTL
eukprot:jgi/Tetstr1/455818/TSEL_042610.t1